MFPGYAISSIAFFYEFPSYFKLGKAQLSGFKKFYAAGAKELPDNKNGLAPPGRGASLEMVRAERLF
jgi:hypothetical protein